MSPVRHLLLLLLLLMIDFVLPIYHNYLFFAYYCLILLLFFLDLSVVSKAGGTRRFELQKDHVRRPLQSDRGPSLAEEVEN